MSKMTKMEFMAIGKTLKEQKDNLLVGSFAAEMVGESYPFSSKMCEVVFQGHTDEELGRRFVKWCDEARK